MSCGDVTHLEESAFCPHGLHTSLWLDSVAVTNRKKETVLTRKSRDLRTILRTLCTVVPVRSPGTTTGVKWQRQAGQSPVPTPRLHFHHTKLFNKNPIQLEAKVFLTSLTTVASRVQYILEGHFNLDLFIFFGGLYIPKFFCHILLAKMLSIMLIRISRFWLCAVCYSLFVPFCALAPLPILSSDLFRIHICTFACTHVYK